MGEESRTTYLLPPPRLVEPVESLPHLGGLELVPYRGELPDEVEPFAPDLPADESLLSERTAAIVERVRKHDQFRKRLAHTRYALIGAVQRGERAKGEPVRHLLVAYDYTNDVAVEFAVSEDNEQAVELSEVAYQPPVSAAEIERAGELARADARLAQADLTDLVQMAIPLDAEATGERAGHRRLEVLFGCENERLPRYRAIVDLSAEEVVSAGSTERCGQRTEGDRS